jgi:putative sigma-54 modulation protein
MTFEITGRHIDVPPREKDRVEERLGRLKRVTGPIDEARIVLTGQKHRVSAEAIISSGRKSWKAHEETSDISSSLTAVLDKIEAQAKKDRARLKTRKGRSSARSLTSEWEVEVLSRQSLATPASERRIVRTSRLPIKPMSAEEAALKLEDSRSEFIVYRDADSEKVSVLYRRKDGDFGLIAPEW